MSSINKAILVGRVGKDPECRYTASGDAVCNLSLATSESWKDKSTGEKKEATEWHRISFFGKLAEIAIEYVKKGSLLYIEGRIKTRKWQDKDGNDRYTTEVVANEMQMLDGRSEGGARSAGGHGDEGGDWGGSAGRGATSQPRRPAHDDWDQSPGSGAAGGLNGDIDDDIPF